MNEGMEINSQQNRFRYESLTEGQSLMQNSNIFFILYNDISLIAS